MDITDKIKTVEDAYKSLGMDRNKSLPVINNVSEEDREHIIATHDLKIITKALNEGWRANFNNCCQHKYYNYFYVDSSGVFRFLTTYCTNSNTGIGSQFCFKDGKLSKYAANQFIELYRKHYLS